MSARQRAQRDAAQGDLASARTRLSSLAFTTGHSDEVCEEIARLSVRMGDPLEAGRWYFLCHSADDAAAELRDRFVKRHHGLRERVHAALPARWTTSPAGLPACVIARLDALPRESPRTEVAERRRTRADDAGGCLIGSIFMLVCGGIVILAIYGAVMLLHRAGK